MKKWKRWWMVEELPGIGFLAGALAALLGGVFIIAGLVAFLLAYGFWTGRGWAWILGIIFSIVGIVLGAVSLIGNSASIDWINSGLNNTV
jgi:uncharacterized membrane protein HdeD (DUF308 family)